MSRTTITARARVKLTIELPVPDSWGKDCAFDQVNKQAVESAISELRKGVSLERFQYSIVGTPEVTAVLLSEAT